MNFKDRPLGRKWGVKRMDKELRRFEINVQTDVNELLYNYGIKDQNLEEEITEKIVDKYCERKGIRR